MLPLGHNCLLCSESHSSEINWDMICRNIDGWCLEGDLCLVCGRVGSIFISKSPFIYYLIII